VIEVPWSARDAIKVFALSWIGLPLLIQLGLILVGVAVPEVRHYLVNVKDDDVVFNFGLALADALAALALVYHYVKRRYHLSWRAVGLRGFNLGKALLLIGGGLLVLSVAVALAYAAIVWLFPHFNPDQAQTNEFTKASSPMAVNLSFVALVLLPPPIEEIVFRGFMFPAFARHFGLIWGALITSLLFGLAHWQLNVSIYTLILSLLLCLLYWRLKSIWPGIFFHMLNNYLAFQVLFHK
jgi:CAAX protease family protein